MSVAFFYPLAWLGALAVGVPIWLHLRRRHETSLVRFSALQFLDDQPLARRRPLWPRDWPLLLLRLLALMLLVAAFTWPYLPGRAEDATIQESCVYILDNTLSNQVDGAFQKARDELVREVSAAGPERQIAVVELGAMPRVLAGFGDDRAEALDRLRALKPTFQRGSYLAAFRAADSLLRQSLGASKRIVLLGDSQENQWAEAGQVLPFLEDTEIALPQVAQASRPNAALAQPSVQRMFLDDRVIAECTVRLVHQGDQKSATVVFYAVASSQSSVAKPSNGQLTTDNRQLTTDNWHEVARREVKLDGRPESIAVSAQWETDPARWLQGEARLEGQKDALAADDRVVFALAPVREGRVALLARSPFLQAALSPEVMKGRWATRVLRASDLYEGQAPPEEEVLCLESQFLQVAPVRSLARSCLEAGKGVVLVVDQATPAAAGFLREVGIEVGAEVDSYQLSVVRRGNRELTTDNRQPATASFRYVSTEHPLFQPFRSADFGNLSEIEVRRHRRLVPVAGGPSASALTSLVFSAEGDPLVIEVDSHQLSVDRRTNGQAATDNRQLTTGNCKLFVLAFAMDRTETNWPIHPTFIPFLDRCLDQARAQSAAQTIFEPGASLVWQVAPGRRVSEVVLKKLTVEGPALDSRLSTLDSQAPVANGQARLSMPDAPGLYAIHYDGRAEVEGVLAVNPPPDESRLTYAAQLDTVKAWVIQGEGQGTRDEGRGTAGESLVPHPSSLDPIPSSKAEIFHQRIWWWLAVAGLAALVLETTWLSLRKGWA